MRQEEADALKSGDRVLVQDTEYKYRWAERGGYLHLDCIHCGNPVQRILPGFDFVQRKTEGGGM